MPLTRNTYARKKSQNDDDNKENVRKENKVRESKQKALKKIEEDLSDESNELTIIESNAADAFDLLRSSPLKHEVNFKPLSFWSKKVKDLECKQTKKKKVQLYELSDADDSSPEGKKIKKGRAIGRTQKKTQKKQKLIPYNFDPRKLRKNEIKVNQNKEGSIFREKIILQRLNDKFSENEDKFSLNKVSDFGLTSTPGKKAKLNLVGGSAFDFLSPVSSIKKMPVIKSDKGKGDESIGEKSGKTIIEEKNEGMYEMKEGICEKNEIKNLKRNPVNYISRVITTESQFEFSDENFLDTIINHQISYEDEMNTTFLNITDDSIGNEDDAKIIESIEGGCNILEFNTTSSLIAFSKKNHMLKSLVYLERLLKLISAELNYDNNATRIESGNLNSGRDTIKEILPVSLMNFTLPLKVTNFRHFTDQSNFSFIHINNSVVQNTDNGSSHDLFLSSNKNTSFSNIQVRRYYNFFLNFRGFEKNEDINLFDDKSTEICVNKSTISNKSCADVLRYTVLNSDSCFFDTSYGNSYHLENTQNSDTYSRESLSSRENLLTVTVLRTGDQQTVGHQTDLSDVTLVGNFLNASNQYCSNETSNVFTEENTKICFNLGNDSSEIVKSSETDTESETECSICKKTFESKEGLVINEELKISSPVPQVTSKTTLKPERIEFSNVNYFRGTKAMRQYKNRSERNPVENNDNKMKMTAQHSPLIQYCPVENTINAEITFNDELDFPLPIFESTKCQSPHSKIENEENRKDKKKGNLSEELGDRSVLYGTLDCLKINDAPSIRLKPGKKWARSAIILKNILNGSQLLDETSSWKKRGKRFQTFIQEVLDMQNDFESQSVEDSQTTVLSVDNLTNKISNMKINSAKERDRSIRILHETGKECTFQNLLKNCSFSDSISCLKKSNEGISDALSDGKVKSEEVEQFSARDQVLMFCNQEAPLPFEKYFNEKTLKNCKKIGEGAFGEVFMRNRNIVFKVIPIEGPDEVNGDRQKSFDEIITEMIIARELSNLRNTESYRTSCFCELKRCWCVFGKYPQYLLDLWNDFDCIGDGSENDSPEMFKSDQLYIILEFENGGNNLEAFIFNSAEQALSIFIQVAFGLTVAERILEFEHRDLHWGNILIAPTREKYFKVTIDATEYKIPTKGVKATIIDFTLSRISYNGCTVFNDLALDPAIFISQGDYQFEIYRLMKNEVMNDWSLFRPKTNLFWLHYVLDKMLTMVHYKKTGIKNHNINLDKLRDLKSQVLECRNCEELIFSKDLTFYRL